MACPLCNRVYCDHTPDERGETQDEMMADCYYGLYKDADFTPEVRTERARAALTRYGDHGMKTAVTLVGQEAAAEIMAALAVVA